MPPQEPIPPREEPHQKPAGDNTAVQSSAAQAREEAHEPVEEQDEWLEEPEELPRRPRRRLLGVDASLKLALFGVLLLACGFIGGVLVEKGQTSSSSGSASASGAAAGFASRFRALREGTSGSGTSTTSTGSDSSGGGTGSGSTGGGFAGRLGGFGGAGASSATVGEVSYISGSTLYVTDAEGNTVKVTTSPASSVTKTVKADLHGIHPGETVVVRGAKGSGGAVSAESISVGAGGGLEGGGGQALFGR